MKNNLLGFLSVFFSVTLVCLQANSISAEGECTGRSGRSILCYECDSFVDTRCKKINESAPFEMLPPFRSCMGCCVKIVQHAHSPKERVRRLCTQQLIINYFIVDHVCMKEGNKRKGHTCFCEEDLCNSSTHHRSFLCILIALFFLYQMK